MVKKSIYLSIGEVSRLTGVHIKSLRYYDRIGVLKPVYVDPNTSYRYYTLSQLKIVETIQSCVELGIPLKQLNRLTEKDGRIHLAGLLELGKELGELKIRAIRDGLKYIDDLQQEIQRNDQLLPSDTTTRVDMPSCYFLMEQISESADEENFYKTLSALYARATEKGYKAGFKVGLLYKYRADKVERYQFIDILSISAGRAEDVVIIPAGTYIVRHLEESKIDQASEMFPEVFRSRQEIIVVEMELLTALYNVEKPVYELLCLAPNIK